VTEVDSFDLAPCRHIASLNCRGQLIFGSSNQCSPLVLDLRRHDVADHGTDLLRRITTLTVNSLQAMALFEQAIQATSMMNDIATGFRKWSVERWITNGAMFKFEKGLSAARGQRVDESASQLVQGHGHLSCQK
jgi:hypothetical protein